MQAYDADNPVALDELETMSERMYDALVKGVVDVSRRIVVLDAEMHADEEQFLLENGSRQWDLWGINLYPADYGTDEFIEFDSMINIRPSQGNRSRDIEDPEIKDLVTQIVAEVVREQ